MEPKAGLAIAGGLGVLGVVAIAMGAGRQTTTGQGVVFQAPDPSSVAAVENAAAAEASSVNALAVQRSQIASQTILGLAGLQEQLNLGTLAARSTDLQTTSNLQTVALQQATSVHATDVAAQVENYAKMLDTGTQQLESNNATQAQNFQTQVAGETAQLASNNGLQSALASLTAQVQAQQINANTATVQSNNATTQAQAQAGAQKTSSFWGALGQIGSAVAGIFGAKK